MKREPTASRGSGGGTRKAVEARATPRRLPRGSKTRGSRDAARRVYFTSTSQAAAGTSWEFRRDHRREKRYARSPTELPDRIASPQKRASRSLRATGTASAVRGSGGGRGGLRGQGRSVRWRIRRSYAKMAPISRPPLRRVTKHGKQRALRRSSNHVDDRQRQKARPQSHFGAVHRRRACAKPLVRAEFIERPDRRRRRQEGDNEHEVLAPRGGCVARREWFAFVADAKLRFGFRRETPSVIRFQSCRRTASATRHARRNDSEIFVLSVGPPCEAN